MTGSICIIGLGLIGGSLLRDLSAAGISAFGYNRSQSGVRAAVREGFDVSSSLEEVMARASSESSLIVIAVPMSGVSSVLDAIDTHAPNCGFTDVVSVKTAVYDLVVDRGMEERYVGGHPMAGTEHSGWKASTEGLFRGAAWVITYDYALSASTVAPSWVSTFTSVAKMITLVGAEAVPSRVETHDAAVARVSHLPHVIAESLAVIGDEGGLLAQSLAAGSFKDATRVASTDPSLVRAMVETNAPAVVSALDEFIEQLSSARTALSGATPDLSDLIESGHRARIRLEARTGARKESVSPVRISSRPVLRLHPGAPGWVRQLRQTEDIGGRIEVF